MASHQGLGTGFFLPQTSRVVPSQQQPEKRGARQSGKTCITYRAGTMARQERRQIRSRAAKGKGRGPYSNHRKEACDEYTSSHERTSSPQSMPYDSANVDAPAEQRNHRDNIHHSCGLASGLVPQDSPLFINPPGTASDVERNHHRTESTICSWVDASQLLSPAATPKSSSSSDSSIRSFFDRSSSLSGSPRAATVSHLSDRSSFARLVDKLHQQASAAAPSGSCGTSSSSIVRSSHSGREHHPTLHVPSSTWPHHQHPGVMCCPPSEGPAW
jgi:hypothetical protein